MIVRRAFLRFDNKFLGKQDVGVTIKKRSTEHSCERQFNTRVILMIIGYIAFAIAVGTVCASVSVFMDFSLAFSFLCYVVGGSVGFCLSVLHFYIRSSLKQALGHKMTRLKESCSRP